MINSFHSYTSFLSTLSCSSLPPSHPFPPLPTPTNNPLPSVVKTHLAVQYPNTRPCTIGFGVAGMRAPPIAMNLPSFRLCLWEMDRSDLLSLRGSGSMSIECECNDETESMDRCRFVRLTCTGCSGGMNISAPGEVPVESKNSCV